MSDGILNHFIISNKNDFIKDQKDELKSQIIEQIKAVEHYLASKRRERNMLGAWGSFPIEISSGGIISDPHSPGKFLIDANTMTGLQKFRNCEIYDPQSDLSALTTSGWPRGSIDDKIVKAVESDTTEQLVLNAEEVIEELQNQFCSHQKLRQLILEAEATEFSVEEEQKLKPILRDFIEKYRDSNDPEDLVAVGSAIRKYVAIMNVSDVGSTTSLLKSGSRAVLSPEVELELVKMIARKFTANPPSSKNTFSELAEQIADLVKAYLNPRILPQGKYAAIAMNGVQALVGMASDKCDDIVPLLRNLPFGWFCEQLSRRLDKLANEWANKLGNDHIAVQHIQNFVQQIKPAVCK